MNKDINTTLAGVATLANMNGEQIRKIEAVRVKEDRDNDEYAEITYENGYRKYCIISGDSNLMAAVEVLNTIMGLRVLTGMDDVEIERDIYE